MMYWYGTGAGYIGLNGYVEWEKKDESGVVVCWWWG